MDERVKALSHLWNVLMSEAPTESLAAETLASLSRHVARNAPESRALRKLLESEKPEVACAAAYRLLKHQDEDLPAAAAILVKHGLADIERHGEAAHTLDALLQQPSVSPIVFDALNRTLWGADHDAAWAAAIYLLDRRHNPHQGILRALVFGGVLTPRWRDAEIRLRNFLSDSDARPAVIDALTVAIHVDNEMRSVAARLLVEAGAPLHDRIVAILNELAVWQPWVPLALLTLIRRQDEAREAARRLNCVELLDSLGTSSS